MSKKMKIIPSIFKNKQAKHPWQWPSCNHPKTLSFGHDAHCGDLLTSSILDQSNSPSFSSGEEEEAAAPPLEVVIRGVRLSERLFFEPEETSSIVKDGAAPPWRRACFKGSVAMAMESDDPYLDFKKSMEEMVESQQGLLKDWDYLEELLLWYLRMNGKMNHGFIIGAFVDLVVGFAAVESKKAVAMVSGSDSTTTSYSSASSSFASPSYPLSPHQL